MAAPAARAAGARAAGGATAGKAAPKFGPGSRGATAGRPKAADELARRAADKKAQQAAAAEPVPAAAPPSGGPAPGPSSSSDGGGSSSESGGFLDGVQAGARQGRRLAPRGGDGGGLVLAFLAWGWVVLPYLQGGTERVRDVLRAKFLNKGPDGEALP